MTQNPTRHGVLAAGSAGAAVGLLGAAAATEAPAISPELERLIAEHRRAQATWEESGSDYGSPSDIAAQDAYEALSGYRCRTTDEVARWARHIVGYATKISEGELLEAAALRALAGLPAEEEEA